MKRRNAIFVVLGLVATAALSVVVTDLWLHDVLVRMRLDSLGDPLRVDSVVTVPSPGGRFIARVERYEATPRSGVTFGNVQLMPSTDTNAVIRMVFYSPTNLPPLESRVSWVNSNTVTIVEYPRTIVDERHVMCRLRWATSNLVDGLNIELKEPLPNHGVGR